MFEVRNDEPAHAFLWDAIPKDNALDESAAPSTNCHGNLIDLVNETSDLHGDSLRINGNEAIGDNPNRYKQHGFFFNADNCIGCHACETACSEKNDNPSHIAFRSVGYVEGGTYPDYQRINISMACNHCDDPVCLKGCPTRAYTKFAEYGAVIQDPDICFGCGYCTWVCPYNAPQLDPVKGEVTKCNMCVDRLEVGLKPACVSACLGNALDFGVVENIPENRIEAKTAIPGFPSTEITQPNIRFQQTRSTQREMTRPDGMPVKYHKDDEAGHFQPEVDKKIGEAKQWNWCKLLTSHESAHVIFTLSTQAVLGAFLLMVCALLSPKSILAALQIPSVSLPMLAVMIPLISFGLFKLNMHLGKPHRFYRGFNNLRWSPLSREIAGVSGFHTFLLGFALFAILDGWLSLGVTALLKNLCAGLASLSGLIGLYYMYRIYRIKARPFWDHWQTASAFVGNTLSLGALLTALVALPALLMSGEPVEANSLCMSLALLALVGLGLEAIGHVRHGRAMNKLGNEGASSWYVQITRYGYPWLIRNALLAISMSMAGSIALLASINAIEGWSTLALWSTLAIFTVVAATISRSLFFVLVIPTTMPGAFFWKNQDFVDHARETGLVDREQVGVVRGQHGKFKLDELIDTIKTTPIKDMIRHAKDIVVWKKLPR
ncbi:MAG: dimethyl sulfoxide reductase anchor subunit [Porticoccaceae bacterium]|nr:dimethyl sulfoxide reductase anchor subunit [Porticoccaceae bacterium]